MNSFLDRAFGVSEAGSTLGTELRGGLTTFATMAYIVVVNPEILSAAGIPFEAAVFATCTAAAIGTLLMAWWARYPFALAPGMGLNAYFAFSVVPAVAATLSDGDGERAWRVALGLVGWSGALFLLATAVQLRSRVLHAIPASLKHAVAAGIGLFIALVGLQRAGVVAADPDTMIGLGQIRSPSVWLAGAGLLLTGALMVRGVRGALLWGIAATTAVAVLTGHADAPTALVALPEPGVLTLQWDLWGALDWRYLDILVALLFVDLFDTVGTLVGVAMPGGFVDQRGQLPRANRALAADASATLVGAALGTSTVTTYVESASGVAEGARTGLANVVVAVGFLAAMLFVPVLSIVPAFATTPALLAVGALMAAAMGRLDWQRRDESLAAFVTALAIPATYSIGDGLALGILTYVGIKALSGKLDEISTMMWVLAALFLLRYLLLPS